jgi:hypothetical protein
VMIVPFFCLSILGGFMPLHRLGVYVHYDGTGRSARLFC